MFMCSIMAAIVVDFPLPVMPTRRMSPRLSPLSFSSTAPGRFRSSKERDLRSIFLATTASPPC